MSRGPLLTPFTPTPSEARMSPTAPRFGAVVAGAAVVAGLLSGCAGKVDPASLATCPSAIGALVVVAGVHQNGPAPDIPQDLSCLLESTVLHGLPVTVIGLDGTPEVVLSGATFRLRTGNEAATRNDAAAGVETVLAAVRGATADSDGSDVVAAEALAHDAAHAGHAPQATVAFLDPMLPDTGALQLTVPGWITAEPDDVADALAAQGTLPPAGDLHFLLYGVGYTTPPQQPLTPAMRQNATDIWTAVLRRGGAAEVTAVPTPRGGDGPQTDHTTGTVPVAASTPPPPPCTSAPLVFENGSAVGFLSESTELREPAAAAEAVAGVATWLRADPTRRADVLGTTADVGPRDGQVALSRARALAVVGLLLDAGVEPHQVSADGAGSDFAGYVPDHDDPVARQANRSVRITLSGPSGC